MFYNKRIKELEKEVLRLQGEIDTTDECADEAQVDFDTLEKEVEIMDTAQEGLMSLVIMLAKKLKVTPKEFAQKSLNNEEAEAFLAKVNAEIDKITGK